MHRHANRPVGVGGKRDDRKNSSHPPRSSADLLEIEWLVFGADHQLERDFVTRRDPAGSQKPSRRTGGRIGSGG